VVDCSVAAKWILPEPGRPSALNLLDSYQGGRVHLIAPDLLLSEFASLLAKRCRRKELSDAQAMQAVDWMTEYAPKLYPVRRRAALELALHHQMSFWDCTYLATAIEFSCSLITADRRLFRGLTPRHPAVRMLA